MIWTPFRDKILIKPISAEETFGSLLIPDTSSNKKKGLVVSVGEGKVGVPMSIIVGSTVLYDPEDACPFPFEGEQYVILKEELVWMIK